jgi:RsiW-degrading membrane proteinase PrsW (M82 family)
MSGARGARKHRRRPGRGVTDAVATVYSSRVNASTHLYLAATGTLPALAAMWYVDRLDRRRPEPAALRRKVALYGALSVIPALIVGGLLVVLSHDALASEQSYRGAAFHAFVIAAAVEEACKIGVVFWVFSRPEFDERLDGIVYAGRAGLGFALVENVLYLLGQHDTGGLVATWVLRALLAIPGHALWTGMMGYFVARRRFDRRGPGIVGGYLLAVLCHGVYDVSVFLGVPLTAGGHRDIAMVLLVVPVAVILLSLAAMRRMAQTALQLDDADAARRPGDLASIAGDALPTMV